MDYHVASDPSLLGASYPLTRCELLAIQTKQRIPSSHSGTAKCCSLGERQPFRPSNELLLIERSDVLEGTVNHTAKS